MAMMKFFAVLSLVLMAATAVEAEDDNMSWWPDDMKYGQMAKKKKGAKARPNIEAELDRVVKRLESQKNAQRHQELTEEWDVATWAVIPACVLVLALGVMYAFYARGRATESIEKIEVMVV
eukprot:TRINITY_DN1463_c3_g1_i1.p3 TRINITY_DN1463_c3_g1~~TRINITY_DN1463_c3_g1_i1.p3  ORF type:complete len:121 (+),score=33.73 TRINITY_DN1463_c3_g1_i1:69-431(+)